MTDPRAEMSIFDAMHPRCRAALSTAPYNFNLASMPLSARNLATGKSNHAAGRFIAWLEREVDAARKNT